MKEESPPKKSWLTTAFLSLAAFLWGASLVTNYFPDAVVSDKVAQAELIQGLRTFSFIIFAAGAYFAIRHLSAQLDYFSKRLNNDVQTGQKTYDLLQKAGMTSREQVEIIKPQDLPQFEKVFAGAKTIRAYNPPLTVLLRQDSHRDVIFNVLTDENSKYRIIAGQSLLPRLKQLRQKWFAQKQATHSEEILRSYLAKMKIISYPHENDLHSEVPNWIKSETDLRGLSFFLVENGARKSVLLYILGSPFVSDFSVPATAIHISMDTSSAQSYDFRIYQSMSEEYERRWGLLMDRVEDNDDASMLFALPDLTLNNNPEED